MEYKTQTEIIAQIDENVTAVEIIRSNENPNRCSVIINDKIFSIGYETEFNFDLITAIKNTVADDTLVIMFVDNELPEAWKQAYEKVDILEKYPNDRRLEFHQYNDMNEMFCIDRMLLWDITDEFKGTEHELTEENGFYRWHIAKWYKNHLI